MNYKQEKALFENSLSRDKSKYMNENKSVEIKDKKHKVRMD